MEGACVVLLSLSVLVFSFVYGFFFAKHSSVMSVVCTYLLVPVKIQREQVQSVFNFHVL